MPNSVPTAQGRNRGNFISHLLKIGLADVTNGRIILVRVFVVMSAPHSPTQRSVTMSLRPAPHKPRPSTLISPPRRASQTQPAIAALRSVGMHACIWCFHVTVLRIVVFVIWWYDFFNDHCIYAGCRAIRGRRWRHARWTASCSLTRPRSICLCARCRSDLIAYTHLPCLPIIVAFAQTQWAWAIIFPL